MFLSEWWYNTNSHSATRNMDILLLTSYHMSRELQKCRLWKTSSRLGISGKSGSRSIEDEMTSWPAQNITNFWSRGLGVSASTTLLPPFGGNGMSLKTLPQILQAMQNTSEGGEVRLQTKTASWVQNPPSASRLQLQEETRPAGHTTDPPTSCNSWGNCPSHARGHPRLPSSQMLW